MSKCSKCGEKFLYSTRFCSHCNMKSDKVNEKWNRFRRYGKNVIVMFVASTLIFLCISCASPHVTTPYSASDCVGKNFSDIENEFASSGFTNIQLEEIADIKPSDPPDKINMVESISIAGVTDFSSGQEFKCNERVLIRYHVYEKYNVLIHVDFIANWIFSRYDVELLLDGDVQGTMEHGVDKDFSLAVSPGEHTLTFQNSESTSVKGEIIINVDCDMEISYRISCSSSEVSVETLYDKGLMETDSSTVESETSTNNTSGMPTMAGTSLSTVEAVAQQYGLSVVFSEKWDKGVKVCHYAKSDYTLTLDVCYSASTYEILFVAVITSVTSTVKEQQDFISAIATVACPTADAIVVGNWVKQNLNEETSTNINGRTYSLEFGIGNNQLYYAGMKEWEDWDLQ